MTILLACLLAIGAVNAADSVACDIVDIDNSDGIEGGSDFLNSPLNVNDDENLKENENDNILADTPKTFIDLNDKINGNDSADVIYLEDNYIFNPASDFDFVDGVVINRSLTIYGNNHILNGAHQARIFYVVAEYGDIELVATLLKGNNQCVKGATVSFKINGKSYKAKTDMNGQAKVVVSGLAPNTYNVVISYNGNTKYNPASGTFDVVVNKITTHIDAYYDSKTNEIVATLINDYTNQGVKGGTVGFVINKVKTLVKTDANGVAKLSLDGVDLTTFKVSVSYAGNTKYFGSVRAVFGAVNKTATYISAVYNKETDEIVATLINNATGKGVVGGTAGIVINGAKNIIKTDASGQAKVSIVDYTSGVYSIVSSYSGNTKYSATSQTVSIVKV